MAGSAGTPILDVYLPAANIVVKLAARPAVVRPDIGVRFLGEAVEIDRRADVAVAVDEIVASIAGVASLDQHVLAAAAEGIPPPALNL